MSLAEALLTFISDAAAPAEGGTTSPGLGGGVGPAEEPMPGVPGEDGVEGVGVAPGSVRARSFISF